MVKPRGLGVRVAKVAVCGGLRLLSLLGRNALCKAGGLRCTRLRPKLIDNLGGELSLALVVGLRNNVAIAMPAVVM